MTLLVDGRRERSAGKSSSQVAESLSTSAVHRLRQRSSLIVAGRRHRRRGRLPPHSPAHSAATGPGSTSSAQEVFQLKQSNRVESAERRTLQIITARKCGMVMLSVASVCLSVCLSVNSGRAYTTQHRTCTLCS